MKKNEKCKYIERNMTYMGSTLLCWSDQAKEASKNKFESIVALFEQLRKLLSIDKSLTAFTKSCIDVRFWNF